MNIRVWSLEYIRAPTYKVITYLETYRHTLNPTHGKDSWPKSDQRPIIQLEPVNYIRGRKTFLRSGGSGEENKGFTNKKMSKGLSIPQRMMLLILVDALLSRRIICERLS